MASMWSGSESIQWNIFARELEGVLKTRKLGLGHLDDRAVVLHPEKVRRLQQSLKTPSHFPVLNPSELDRLNAIMALSDDERSRLRAALIATAAERALMDRLEPQTALMASNDVFEICLAAMHDQPALALATAVRAGDVSPEPDVADLGSDEVVSLLDAGAFALDGAEHVSRLPARRTQALAAQELFARAIALLEVESSENEVDETWHSRMDEAREGHTLAGALLQKAS